MQRELTETMNEAANAPEFHQMADSMKKAMGDFENIRSEDVISALASYLTPISEACVSGWNSATRFVRRHPVETSLAVGCVGLLCAYLLMPSRSAKSSRTKTA